MLLEVHDKTFKTALDFTVEQWRSRIQVAEGTIADLRRRLEFTQPKVKDLQYEGKELKTTRILSKYYNNNLRFLKSDQITKRITTEVTIMSVFMVVLLLRLLGKLILLPCPLLVLGRLPALEMPYSLRVVPVLLLGVLMVSPRLLLVTRLVVCFPSLKESMPWRLLEVGLVAVEKVAQPRIHRVQTVVWKVRYMSWAYF